MSLLHRAYHSRKRNGSLHVTWGIMVRGWRLEKGSFMHATESVGGRWADAVDASEVFLRKRRGVANKGNVEAKDHSDSKTFAF